MDKKMSLSDLILLTLEKSTDGLVRIEDFTYNTHLYKWGWDRPLKKSSFAQALRRLRLKGYINKDYFENKMILKLTDKGKSEAIFKKTLVDDRPWDGKWRVVVFDIPEEHRKLRKVLRSRLKLWKFKQLQKSVWVSKRDILKEMKEFIKEIGISKWVNVFEAVDLTT